MSGRHPWKRQPWVFLGFKVLDRELFVDFSHRKPIIATVRQQKDPERERLIGSFVRQRRISASLTQQQLGELAGVGKRFVVELEAGKATVRLDKVNLVLAVFGKRIGVEDAPRQRPFPSDDDI
jgi:y4mF family transcriptional regulator